VVSGVAGIDKIRSQVVAEKVRDYFGEFLSMAVVNFLGRAIEGLCVYRERFAPSETLGNE
jgi:hypothetical protein